MTARKNLRIAIDAQILPWRNGGVAHALLALVRALADLPDGEETYRLVVASEEEEAFWRPNLGANQDVALRTDYDRTRAQQSPSTKRSIVSGIKTCIRPWFRRVQRRIALPKTWPEVPLSDGFYESLGCDVLHLPWQRYVICSLPTLYNPHDLQHLHYPQFWKPEELAWRDVTYATGCRFARKVIVGSQWAKDDLTRQYALDPAKVQVIPEGSQLQLSQPINGQIVQQVRDRYRLPETYLLYPAIMWPHKNHLRLLDALALLRDKRGLVVSLVFTGTKLKDFWPQIERRIGELRLKNEVYCPGFVSETDLRVIQRSAHGLVQPSLFEASSLPIFDAWLEGVPVACARATGLPEQVGEAALLFDPLDASDIAAAIEEIMTNAERRRELRTRGFRRLKDFDWRRTARTYRAAYRWAAGTTLNEEDRWLLA